MQIQNRPVQNTQALQRSQQPQQAKQTLSTPAPGSPQGTGNTQRFEQASQRSLPTTEDIESDIESIDNSQPNPERLASLNRGGVGMGTNIHPDYNENRETQGNVALDPSTQASRFADLEWVAQRDDNPETMFDDERCGASCIVGAMYYAEGRQGLLNLMTDIENYDNSVNVDAYTGDLRQRLENGGEITRGDLNNLQEVLHSTMLAHEAVQGSTAINGMDYRTIQHFITHTPHVQGVFDDQNMAIAYEDTNGNNQGNHFVLNFQHNGRAAIYDPFPINGVVDRMDQVTQENSRLTNYRNARDTASIGSEFVYNGAAH